MHMAQRFHASLPLALGALLLAGCTAPTEPLAARLAQSPQALPDATDPGGPAGGGRVLNAPPRVLSFEGSLARADNGGGSTEVFRALVADDNAEGDLASVGLVGQGPQRFALSHSLTARDLAQRAESPGPDGWAVWDAVPMDGLLQVSVRVTYPYGAATGEYAWALTVRDGAGLQAQGGPDLTLVEPVHVVEVEGAVTAGGEPASAEGWGGWSAAPGARQVPSVTYLKVVNKGTAAGQAFVVDFTSRHFTGVEDRNWRVPLDGNVRFGWFEASPGQAPRDGSLTWGDVSPDGSVALQFTRSGAVVYIAYEVAQVPTPLPSQVYYASATVTAL